MWFSHLNECSFLKKKVTGSTNIFGKYRSISFFKILFNSIFFIRHFAIFAKRVQNCVQFASNFADIENDFFSLEKQLSFQSLSSSAVFSSRAVKKM